MPGFAEAPRPIDHSLHVDAQMPVRPIETPIPSFGSGEIFSRQSDVPTGGNTREPFRLDLTGQPEVAERIASLPTTTEQFAKLGLTPESAKEAREKQQLAGKVFLVIGTGPESMGEAAAVELAARGGYVIGVTRSESGAGFMTKANGIAEDGYKRTSWISADITKLHTGTKKMEDPDKGRIDDPQHVDNFLAGVINAGQIMRVSAEMTDIKDTPARLDGVIIACGTRKDMFMSMASDEDVKTVMEGNFHAPLRIIQAAYRSMRRPEQRQGIVGRVVALSSKAHEAAPSQGGYGPSKAALNNAVRSLIMEQQRRSPDSKLTVNAVSPGLVATGFVNDLTDEMRTAVLVDTDADRELTAEEMGVLMAHMVTEDLPAEINGMPNDILGRGEVVDFGHPKTA